jgi:3-methyladenine DNA glycosylase AlkC
VLILAAISLAQLALVAFVLWDRGHERREHMRQVADLCQRIQAPQSAVVMHEQAMLPPSPAAISPDDDEAWHDRGLTRDQMVAQMQAANG